MVTEEDVLKARILVVDDQEANVKLIERLLQEAGYVNITTTVNPREVCRLHSTHDYDLIVLDLQMPGMDGFEVMESMRPDSAGYLPVIALTADPSYKLRALQAGVRDFLSKPFDLMEVRTRIRNMLEVRLLYRHLQRHTDHLELLVEERTAELRASEARYRSLTELAADWYWEQDETGKFTKAFGPIIDMLGITALPEWNEAARQKLVDNVAARKPFLNLALTRTNRAGQSERFLVSGEPIFDDHCRFAGYRGVGIEVTTTH